MTPSDIENLKAAALAVKGWKLNAVQQSEEQKEDGIAVFGGVDEDGNFYDVGTVDTGLYHQPDLAIPLADYIVKAATAVPDLIAENERLQALAERLKLEAHTHAQEARTANATIAEIYQVVSGSTGEPGNWNGAEPVRELFNRLSAEVEALRADAGRWRHLKANKENYVPMFERAGELGFDCPKNPKPEEFKAWDMGLFGRCSGTMNPAWHLRKEGSPENFTKAFEMGWLGCMAYVQKTAAPQEPTK